MGRFLTVPFVLVALLIALIGAVAAAYHLRSRQSELDRELSQSWLELGDGLDRAAAFLRDSTRTGLDPELLSKAAGDTAVQARLESLGSRVDSICRNRGGLRGDSGSIDSLRESIRRDRERVGLVLAHYREERHSLLGKWLLKGFPER